MGLRGGIIIQHGADYLSNIRPSGPALQMGRMQNT